MACFGYGDDKGSWLFAEPPGGLPGTGDIYTISVTNPGAGNEIPVQVVQPFCRWKLLTVIFNLLTSGVANSRLVFIAYQSSAGSTFMRAIAPSLQAASLTFVYNWAINVFNQAVLTSTGQSGEIEAVLPDQVFLQPPSGSWGTATLDRDAGDTYTAVGYTVEEWVYPVP
jgi:hypothetical protein